MDVEFHFNMVRSLSKLFRCTIGISVVDKEQHNRFFYCHLGIGTEGGNVVWWADCLPKLRWMFFLNARSKWMLFIKWVLAVLFLLQTLSYFCIGMNEWMIILRIWIRNGQTPYSVMRILMLCIVFLYIVCSSPSSKKWLFFVDSVHLTHFWKWDLSSIKKKVCIKIDCNVVFCITDIFTSVGLRNMYTEDQHLSGNFCCCLFLFVMF